MNTQMPGRVRAALAQRNRYRCQVEELDRRLPPGALLGPLGLSGWVLDAPVSAPRESDQALFRDPAPTAALRVLSPTREAVAVEPDFTGGGLSLTVSSVPISRDNTSGAAGIPVFDTLPLETADGSSLLGAILNAGAAVGPAGTAESRLTLRAEAMPANLSLTRPESSENDLLTRLLLRGRAPADAPTAQANQLSPADEFGQVPLWFEANVGQTDAAVGFLSRGAGYALFLTPTEAVLSLQQATTDGDDLAESATASQPGLVVRMEFAGANPAVALTGGAELAGKVNYFTGNDPSQWRSNVPTFGQVEYPQLYPGIDLVWYANAQNQLEHDFVVTPGADPAAIALQFRGVDRLEVDAQGDLLLHTPLGTLRQPRPFTYQESGGVRQEIASSYTVTDTLVGFAVGTHDASLPLVIDPVLSYSTFLGGSEHEDGYAIAVDAAGSAYVAGSTASTDFPTTAGVVQPTSAGLQDAFVAKLNPDGSGLEYATYLGGSQNDRAHAIAVDGEGNAYVAGRAGSDNFPTTAGTMQMSFRGGAYEAFATKVNPTGSGLVWSTYLGGDSNDAAFGIAVDAAGQAYVTGGTLSQDFPVTPTAFQFFSQLTDAFMTVLLADGSNTPYSTYIGSSGAQERANAIAVDVNGMVYIAGQTRSDGFSTSIGAVQPTFAGGLTDGFVVKFDPTQTGESSFVYGTYVGGTEDDRVFGIAVDTAGNAYVTGTTGSTDYPLVNGFQGTYGGGLSDAFVTKLDPTGSSYVYSTFLGGSGDDKGTAIALNAAGEAYLTGATTSADFPVLNPIQATLGGMADAFVARVAAGGDALIWSTFLGGSDDENVTFNDTTNQGGIALDPAGNVYVIGRTASADYPTLNPLQPTYGGNGDAFIAKITETAGPGVLFCFVLSPDSGTISAGTALTLTLTALDSNLDVVADYTGEVAFFTNDAAATIPATYTFQLADMGVATFPGGFIFQTPGLAELYVFDTATYQVYGYAAFTVQ